MKAIILFTLVFTSAALSKKVPQETADKFAKIIAPHSSECKSRSKVDLEIALKWETSAVSTDDHNLKRYIRCLFEGMGFYSADGEMSRLAMKQIAETLPGGTDKVISDCLEKAEKFDDPYESAYQFNLCAIELFSE